MLSQVRHLSSIHVHATETYLVWRGIVASASYGACGHACEIVVSPQRLWNSTIDSKQLTEIINKIVPENQREEYLMDTFVNSICFPTQDCNGTAGTWGKVDIFRNGGYGRRALREDAVAS
jgi:(2Fe-2S) ferredoxin